MPSPAHPGSLELRRLAAVYVKRNGLCHTCRRMNSATIKQITSAANKHNEDLVRIYRSAHFTDIVIMDGASSVGTRNFIDNVIGDVAWFVRTFRRKPAGSMEEGARDLKPPTRTMRPSSGQSVSGIF